MIFPAAVGFLVVVILFVFFYRTVKMDLTGAIATALLAAAGLALLAAAAISVGQLFG
jgi:hypothetical protein